MLSVALVSPGVPNAEATELDGFVKGWAGGAQDQMLPTVLETTSGQHSGWLAVGFRLDAIQTMTDSVKLNASYVGYLRSGDATFANLSQFLEEPSTAGFRVADLGARSYKPFSSDDQRAQYRQNLDRLFVESKFDDFDLTVGRQPISWGVARGIRPLEFITQNLLSGLDAQERNGVDAIRVRAPTGSNGELDSGVVFGSHFDQKQSAAYLRDITTLGHWELTTLAGRFLGNEVLGLGSYTSIEKLGVRLEAAEVLADNFAGIGTGNYFRGTLGTDFGLGRDSYVFVEYHYNGAGAADRAGIVRLLDSKGFQTQELLLQRQHYAVAGLAYQSSPIAKISGYVIYGMDERDALANLAYQYTLSDDWFLGVALIAGIGARDRTEFGAYGRALYFTVSRYF